MRGGRKGVKNYSSFCSKEAYPSREMHESVQTPRLGPLQTMPTHLGGEAQIQCCDAFCGGLAFKHAVTKAF